MANAETVPPAERYFEDYHVGMVDEFGEVVVTAEEIVAFARRYDPQAMHVDPAAAAQGAFGGLIASGWHTAAMVMRLFVEHYLSKVATLPSPGIDELRWTRPVRPGDTLRVRVTVVETQRSRSQAGPRNGARSGGGAEPERRGGDEPAADEPDALPELGCHCEEAKPTKQSPTRSARTTRRRLLRRSRS